MNYLSKQMLTIVLSLAVFTATVAKPNRADAAIGVTVVGAGLLLIVGIPVVLYGAGETIVGIAQCIFNYDSYKCDSKTTLKYFLLLAIGFVAADGDGEYQLAPLSETQGSELGLTIAELNAYNDELPVIRLIGQSSELAATQAYQGSERNSEKAAINVAFEQGRSVWLEAVTAHKISDDAASAVVKIARNMQNAL